MLRLQIPLKSKKNVTKAVQILRESGCVGTMYGLGCSRHEIAAQGAVVVSEYEITAFIDARTNEETENILREVLHRLSSAKISGMNRTLKILSAEVEKLA